MSSVWKEDPFVNHNPCTSSEPYKDIFADSGPSASSNSNGKTNAKEEPRVIYPYPSKPHLTHDPLLIELANMDCIHRGKVTLHSNKISTFYFNIKNLVSHPALLKKVGEQLHKLMPNTCDLVCGVPTGAVPLTCFISTNYDIPMVTIRTEVKKYGMTSGDGYVEGKYEKDSTCVLIEDVVTSGSSIKNAVGKLNRCGIRVTHILSVIDRQEIKSDFHSFLEKENIEYSALFTKTDLFRYYFEKLYLKSRICFSADLARSDEIIRILKKIGPHIAICKLHSDTIVGQTDAFVNELVNLSIQYDFLIMEDRKLVDISSISQRQYANCGSWNDCMTIHAVAHPTVIEKIPGSIIVAQMSNTPELDFSDRALDMAKEHSHNVLGFVGQHRVDTEHKFWHFMPGVNVGEQNSESDQKYRSYTDVDTDFVIMGRSIYRHSDPEEFVKNIKEKLSTIGDSTVDQVSDTRTT